MVDSILLSVKKLLGISREDNSFDMDLIIHINSIFVILFQMGVGPDSPFSIQDEGSKWTDFIEESDKKFDTVKSYVFMKCRMMFDPPSGSTMDAYNNVLDELTFRLSVSAESEII